MKENRTIASAILQRADKIISSERGNQHGGAENSFEMIAQMWNIWLLNSSRMRHSIERPAIYIDAVDVAEMMSLLKKARFVHGDPSNADNFIDDVGYSALAAMLSPEQATDQAATAETVDPVIEKLEQGILDARRNLEAYIDKKYPSSNFIPEPIGKNYPGPVAGPYDIPTTR